MPPDITHHPGIEGARSFHQSKCYGDITVKFALEAVAGKDCMNFIRGLILKTFSRGHNQS